MSNQCFEGDQHLKSAKFQELLGALKETDPELAYLVALTREGLKPLSRWEKSLTDNELKILHQMGLLTKQIHRTVKAGDEIIETIFSRTPAYIQLYEQSFGYKHIDKSSQTQRFEGFLFGYPPCCVDQYVLKPYSPNNLTQQEQRILFHWACRDCKVTPLLLPGYKSIYDLLELSKVLQNHNQ